MSKVCVERTVKAFPRHAAITLLTVFLTLSCDHFQGHKERGDSSLTVAEVKKLALGGATRPVRFQGVVTLVDPIFEFFVVQDETGGIRIQQPSPMDVTMMGRRVEVTGRTALEDQLDAIDNAVITDRGPAAYPAPKPVSFAQLASLDDEVVHVAGVVKDSETNSMNRRSMLVGFSEHGREITARLIVIDNTGQPANLVDASVEFNAVSSAIVGVDGKVSGFSLVAPDFASMRVVTAPREPESLPLLSISTLVDSGNSTALHRVRVRGRVSRASGELEIVDATGSIPLLNTGGIDGRAADAVGNGLTDFAGFVSQQDSRRVFDYAMPIPAGKDSKSERVDAPLTSAASVRSITAEKALLEQPVRLDGVITYVDQRRNACFFQDDSAGIYISLDGVPEVSLRPGDHVVVSGVTGPGEFAPIVQKPRFEILGKASFPQPSRLDAEEIFLGRADSQWVVLEGIIQSIKLTSGQSIAVVASGPHKFDLALPAGRAQFPASWIDHTVRVSGPAGTVFNPKRQLVGVEVMLPTLSFATLLESRISHGKPPPEDSLISSLMQFRPFEGSGHRITLRARVVSSQLRGPSWIQDDTGGAQVVNHNPVNLIAGDVVEVKAFAGPGAFSPILHDAYIRKIGSGPPPRPIPQTVEEILDGHTDSQFVQIDGQLVNQYVSDKQQILLMRVGKLTFTVHIADSSFHFDDGSVLRAIGICSLKGRSIRSTFAPYGFEIFVDSPQNLTLLQPAPWLTQARLTRVFGIAVACVSFSFCWVIILRRRVTMQTSVISQKLVEVESLREAAEQANHAKSDFLANMSHEIRTPMNGILGMTELTLGSDLEAEQRENLSIVKASAESLLTIINDVLDFSKIDAGKLELDPIEFDIRNNIEDAMRALAFRAHEKRLELVCNFPPGIPENVIGDPTRLRQIVTNLVSNAVKFTQSGEVTLEVLIESSQSDSITLHFVVSDTGCGIPVEKQQAVFAPFVQADTSTTREYGGTGLGLTICKRFVEMMKGTLWLESTVGVGSRFHFTAIFGRSESAPVRSPGAEQASLDGVPVLIVDDNATNRRVLAQTVASWGMTPTPASGAEEAWNLLLSAERDGSPFQFLLSDVNMPEMDGFELAERIADEVSLHKLNRILLTPAGQRGDGARCRQLGVAGYLTKPVRQGELHAALTSILASNRDGPLAAIVTRHSLPRELPGRKPILVAEDNLVNQKVIKRLIERRGYVTRIVSSGLEALKAVEEQEFDLIFMDIQMPVMDGFKATSEIRRRDKSAGKHNHIVAMTAHAMQGDRERCLQAGMDDYLSKPIDIQKLNELLERFVPA